MITSIKQVNIEVLETIIAQQAAVIEQMREALKVITRRANCLDVLEIARTANEALALQPCPEVLNKVRADAIRDGLAAWENTVEPIYKFMNDYAQRIEQGEA